MLLGTAALIFLLPVLWIVVWSFAPSSEILTSNSLIPRSFTLQNYEDGWQGAIAGYTFASYIINSMTLSVLAVLGTVASCSLTAYAFVFVRLPFKRIAFAAILLTTMLPYAVLVLPQYDIFKRLGLLDSMWPIVIPQFLGVHGFFVFLVIQFMRGVPTELREAALLDGAGDLRILVLIMFPILRPVLVVVALLSFLWTWDDFFSQLVYLNSPSKQTVNLALRTFLEAATTGIGPVLAMTVVSLLPATIFLILFRRQLVEGTAQSGLR